MLDPGVQLHSNYPLRVHSMTKCSEAAHSLRYVLHQHQPEDTQQSVRNAMNDYWRQILRSWV